ETGLAKTLDIHVGDSLTFDVAGQGVRMTVSGLRKVDWDCFQANFFAVASPAALADAPASFLTSFHVAAEGGAQFRDLLHEFPNLTVFDVGAILGQLQHVLDQATQAVQLLIILTLLSGVLVLEAALYSSRNERIYEV